MIVLDTHTWVWWAAGSPKISAAARHGIDGARQVAVCAISCWEVAMLVAKGRLELDRDVLTWIRSALALPRVTLLPLSPEIAVAAVALSAEFAGDPADRMIAATALHLGAPIVTRDRRLRSAGGLRVIW